jgi:methionyl-tRNA formyltransferase
VNGSTLRLAFAGTPELAAVILGSLATNPDYRISHVYTQPDRPAGRGRKILTSAVKQTAQKYHIRVLQPGHPGAIDPDDELSQVDVLVVAAYGMLLPATILAKPRLGCINVHTSLLPRWRGAAPIQRAIQAGDRETGITIMQMDEGLDTGDILAQEKCPILAHDTGGSLHDKLAALSTGVLNNTLHSLSRGTIKPQRQNAELATYARKISKTEARIEWSRPACEIERMIRAFNPFPVAFTELAGLLLRVWAADIANNERSAANPGAIADCSPEGIIVQTGRHDLRITRLQLPGKKPVSAKDFLNGHPDFVATAG